MTDPLINVAIVDDHNLFRSGIINLLNEREEINILFDAKDGLDMQNKIRQYGVPDVILMDVNMPVMDGCEATRWVKKEYPQVHVLALSMIDQEVKIITMIKYGAGGYLLKDSTTDEVAKGISSIAKTGVFLNEHLSGRLFSSIRNNNGSKNYVLDLTKREKEFMYHCCSEMPYKEIAVKMDISVKTVNNYREALFEKLNLKSRVGLVLFAIKNDVVKVTDIPTDT